MVSHRNVASEHSLAMGIAIKALKARGITYQKKTEFQIKVGEWNFYPTSGAIYRDGDPHKIPQRGLDEFIKLVKGKDSGIGIDHNAPDDSSPPVGVDLGQVTIVSFPSLD